MGKAFADRWGVPVRAGNADAVALLDSAIEDLAALAGDPMADADAAVAADDSLVLGHIYRAYLQLYGTTPEGVAAAGEILKRLDETIHGRAGTPSPARRPALGRRRLGSHHPRAGAGAAAPPARPARAQGRPGPLLLPRQPAGAPRHRRPGAARLARDPARLGVRAGHLRVRAGGERGLPAGRVARPGRPGPQPEGRLVGARAGARLRDGRQPAGRRRVPHRLGSGLVSRASSPSTTGGTAACTTWSWARSARRSPCTTTPSGRGGPPSGSTWWTRPRCCGGCRCSAWT